MQESSESKHVRGRIVIYSNIYNIIVIILCIMYCCKVKSNYRFWKSLSLAVLLIFFRREMKGVIVFQPSYEAFCIFLHVHLQVGEIVAYDALINNVDRIPLLWDNEGDTVHCRVWGGANELASTGSAISSVSFLVPEFL